MINNSMYNFMVNNTSDYTRDSLTYFGNRISRGELLVLIDKFALYLNKCGIKKGDVVAVCLPNIPDAIIAIYAANKIGAVCNIIHPLTSANNILKTLSETKCRMLFISDFKYFKDIEELKKCNADIVISSISGFMKGFSKFVALFQERRYRRLRTGEKYFTECLKEEVVQKQLSSKFNGDELAVLLLDEKGFLLLYSEAERSLITSDIYDVFHTSGSFLSIWAEWAPECPEADPHTGYSRTDRR